MAAVTNHSFTLLPPSLCGFSHGSISYFALTVIVHHSYFIHNFLTDVQTYYGCNHFLTKYIHIFSNVIA